MTFEHYIQFGATAEKVGIRDQTSFYWNCSAHIYVGKEVPPPLLSLNFQFSTSKIESINEYPTHCNCEVSMKLSL